MIFTILSIPPQTRYRTQANALLRKNVVYQARNRCTNVCVISMPILFILLLFGIQQAVNFTFGGRKNKVRTAICTRIPSKLAAIKCVPFNWKSTHSRLRMGQNGYSDLS